MPLYEWVCPKCDTFEDAITDSNVMDRACASCTGAMYRKFPLPAQHKWKCSTDGAMPKGAAEANREEDRKLAKRERVLGMQQRQMDKIDGKVK